MAFFRRLAKKLFNPTGYVGKDLQGNTFYEHIHPLVGRRPKRTVKYFREEEIWDYIGGGRHLPAQWSSWLAHTRAVPPTFEELLADQSRRQQLQVRVAAIEARDREEQLQRLQSPHQTEQRTIKEPDIDVSEYDERMARIVAANAAPTPEALPSASLPVQDPWKTPISDEPESWSPTARPRKG